MGPQHSETHSLRVFGFSNLTINSLWARAIVKTFLSLPALLAPGKRESSMAGNVQALGWGLESDRLKFRPWCQYFPAVLLWADSSLL